MHRPIKIAKLTKHLELELKTLKYNQITALEPNRPRALKTLLRLQDYITIINKFPDNKVALNQDIRRYIRRTAIKLSYITARVRLTKTKYFEYSPWSTVIYQIDKDFQMTYKPNDRQVLQTILNTDWTELYRHEALYKPGSMHNWIQTQIYL